MNHYFQQRGLSIVELLVAIVISLVLSAAASYAFVAGQKVFVNSSELGNINQQGQFALDALGQNIRAAGAPPIELNSKRETFTTDLAVFDSAGAGGKALEGGCITIDTGGLNSATPVSECTGGKATTGVLVVRYYTDSSGKDCLGNSAALVSEDSAPVTTNKKYLVTNTFFLSENSYKLNGVERTFHELSCKGGVNTPQPMFKGIEQLRLRYGVASAAGSGRVGLVKDVAAMVDADWDNVLSVNVCILMRTDMKNTGASGAISTTDCNDVAITDTQQYVWRKLSSTFTVRNRIAGRAS